MKRPAWGKANSLAVPLLSVGAALLISCSSGEENEPGDSTDTVSGGSQDGRNAQCEDQKDQSGVSYDDYTAGITETGDQGVAVAILDADPSPPRQYENLWTVSVEDADGQAVTGATIEINAQMPAHGHGANGQPVITDNGDGTYVLDTVNFFMPGLWTIELDVQTDAMTDSVMFAFCVP